MKTLDLTEGSAEANGAEPVRHSSKPKRITR